MNDAVKSGSELRRLIENAPPADQEALRAARAHQAVLTKPAGALGRLEEIAEWLAAWQGRHPPRAARVQIIVFAANHGIAARGVSAYPSTVTAQMVANFAAGGAAINQLSGWLGASLQVIPLALDTPTGDITREAAMDEDACLAAWCAGMTALDGEADLVCLGEMGIGNTTIAAALSAALFGGDGGDWAGRGTGIDDASLARKIAAIDDALSHHGAALADPLEALRRLGGREFAAIAGATLAARHARVPVLLDGFACSAAAATLYAVNPSALDHCLVAHNSVEPGHARLLKKIDQQPLLDFSLRLGEGSGAALAAGMVRAAAAIHTGMATFASAGVSGPAD
ncbi:MAG: nicotinate-nucleotide--dimethylbenzimidazole phosphoribosyltransferase [Proteobacteria bacterium]|nr:nicotinate-nucleotide--dimethylbenzimidazole phosphoribosyltransferase [Pseudomonadota bacterium]MDA1355621.1 nicotinate-nucleotide--dimethylbenzimidazole phosphoribosyltransferase [Pseudomonadota bacterium]